MIKHLILFLQLLGLALGNFNLLILHNNDIHGRFKQISRKSFSCHSKDGRFGCYGGAARAAHLIRKFRKYAEDGVGPEVLFLNAGDTFVGTLDYSLHSSETSAAFMNALLPDVQCLGSHEFDKGLEELEKYVSACNFSTIGGNILFSSPKLQKKIPRSVVIEKNGTKIGIVGHLTRKTEKTSKTEDTVFLDEIKTIKDECIRLNNQGIHIIIILGHSGYDKDKTIAKQVPDVDVVVGGYSHTFLWTGSQPDLEPIEGPYPTIVTQSSGKRVPVVQAHAYGKYLGCLNLTFDEFGELLTFTGQPFLLDSSILEEEDVLKLERIHKRDGDEEVGTILHILRPDNCKERDCCFGNILADALVMYRASSVAVKWTDAPIALIHAGLLTSKILPPTVSRDVLTNALPQERVVVLTIKGNHLWNILEKSVSNSYDTDDFLQVSGLIIMFDEGGEEGNRITSIAARSSIGSAHYEDLLDQDLDYTIVTLDHIVNSDQYPEFNQYARRRQHIDMDLLEIFIWYLSKNNPAYVEEGLRLQPFFSRKSSCEVVSNFNIFVIIIVFLVLTSFLNFS